MHTNAIVIPDCCVFLELFIVKDMRLDSMTAVPVLKHGPPTPRLNRVAIAGASTQAEPVYMASMLHMDCRTFVVWSGAMPYFRSTSSLPPQHIQ